MKSFILHFAICILQFAIAARAQSPSTQPSGATTQPATPAYPFPLYNASGHDLPGALPCHVVGMQFLWRPGDDRTKLPDPDYVRQQMAAWPDVLTLIDDEPPAPAYMLTPAFWDATTPAQCRANVQRDAQLLKLVRAARPDLAAKIDLWDRCVSDDYGGEADPNLVQRALNDVASTLALAPIARLSHVVAIAAYRQAGQSDNDYRAHAVRLIYRARLHGKPVLITVCPANVDPAAFVQDVQVLAHYADGVIVWDWDPQNQRTAWIAPLAAALAK